MKTANKVVEQARAWLGRKESDGSHKEIVDVYNSHKPLARGYQLKYTDDWCSAFVSAVAIKLGYTDIIPTEVGCEKHIQLFKALGSWDENDNRVPKPGDIIFYDWQDSGVGDNTGFADHVGIVEKVEGNTITVIEGNYGNSVKRRSISVNGRYIRGFGVPKYDALIEPVYTAPSPAQPPSTPKTIKEVQSYLNAKLGVGLAVDGSYGPLTRKALIKYWQKTVGGLDVDGSFGPLSKAAASRNNISKGSKGELVRIMQMALICKTHNLNPYGADGSFGPATEKELKAYQAHRGLGADGICGSKTWTNLFS